MHTNDEPTVSSSFPEMPTSPRCLEQFVTTLESPFLSSTLSQASATNFDVTLPSTATFRRGLPMDADCLIQSLQSMAAQSNARWHGFRNRKRRDTSLAGRVALPRDRLTGKAAILAAGKWGDKRQATCDRRCRHATSASRKVVMSPRTSPVAFCASPSPLAVGNIGHWQHSHIGNIRTSERFSCELWQSFYSLL